MEVEKGFRRREWNYCDPDKGGDRGGLVSEPVTMSTCENLRRHPIFYKKCPLSLSLALSLIYPYTLLSWQRRLPFKQSWIQETRII